MHDLQAFALWFQTSNGEVFSPRAVDPRDITEYRGYLLRTGSKSSTINRRLISLRRFFKWAHRRELVTDNPMTLTDPPRKPKHLPKPARADVIGTAVQAAAELAEIGLSAGARALRGAVSRLPRP